MRYLVPSGLMKWYAYVFRKTVLFYPKVMYQPDTEEFKLSQRGEKLVAEKGGLSLAIRPGTWGEASQFIRSILCEFVPGQAATAAGYEADTECDPVTWAPRRPHREPLVEIIQTNENSDISSNFSPLELTPNDSDNGTPPVRAPDELGEAIEHMRDILNRVENDLADPPRAVTPALSENSENLRPFPWSPYSVMARVDTERDLLAEVPYAVADILVKDTSAYSCEIIGCIKEKVKSHHEKIEQVVSKFEPFRELLPVLKDIVVALKK